jgi:ribosomal protein L4
MGDNYLHYFSAVRSFALKVTTNLPQSSDTKQKMSRPVVSVFDPENPESVLGTVSLPAVFTAPIRSDVVQHVHTLMAKNARQAYAVSLKAGHQVKNYKIHLFI